MPARRASAIAARAPASPAIPAPTTTNLRTAEDATGVHPEWETFPMADKSDDEKLLRKAEEALTEIKVNQGLSERHAAVLAALRIRLKGTAGKSLDEMIEAADDPESAEGGSGIDELFAKEQKPKRSLDDLFAEQPKKPEWPS